MTETMTTRPPGHIENDVLVGQDGMLFLAGGAHRVLAYLTGQLPLPAASLTAFQTNHRARVKLLDQRGIGFVHLITPDKHAVVPQLWPFPDQPPRLLADALLAQMGDATQHILHPRDQLRAAGLDAVSRVDSHYTDLGTIIVAAAVAERLTGQDPAPQHAALLAGLTAWREQAGDLGGKLSPPVTAREKVYARGLPGRMLTNDVRGGNTGIIDIHLNPAAALPQRLAVLGDSFGRHVAKFLRPWFREILFVRSQFFHPEMLGLFQPHHVVTQNVERYLANTKPDENRGHFLLLPLGGREPYTPSGEFVSTLQALLAVGRRPYADFTRQEFGS